MTRVDSGNMNVTYEVQIRLQITRRHAELRTKNHLVSPTVLVSFSARTIKLVSVKRSTINLQQEQVFQHCIITRQVT